MLLDNTCSYPTFTAATCQETSVDARDNQGYVFYFPQRNADGSPTIPKDVKEIEFFTQVGLRRFQAKFRPAEMVIPDGVDYF